MVVTGTLGSYGNHARDFTAYLLRNLSQSISLILLLLDQLMFSIPYVFRSSNLLFLLNSRVFPVP